MVFRGTPGETAEPTEIPRSLHMPGPPWPLSTSLPNPRVTDEETELEKDHHVLAPVQPVSKGQASNPGLLPAGSFCHRHRHRHCLFSKKTVKKAEPRPQWLTGLGSEGP